MISGRGRQDSIRILHLITTLDVGGAEVMLMRLLTALDPNLFSSRVVCMASPGEIGEQIGLLGIPVSCLNFQRGRIALFGILKWFKILHEYRPEIIQAWMYHANLMALSAPLAVVNARVFWNIQASGRDPSGFKALTRGVIRTCSRLSAFPEAVIVNSKKGVADHCRMGYRSGNLNYIPNGFDVNLYLPLNPEIRRQIRRTLGIDDETPCVGMFARYHPVKDHFTALLAARGVQESGLRAHFFFAGAGVDHGNTAICHLISRLGLESSAHLLGYRKDVASLMAAMDTVISCSHSEGLSNVIGEAMAAGVPCVVTDVGDSALVVGDTGKTVKPQDPEALARAILEILRMPADKRKALGGKARARIQHHYAIEKVADTYSRLYQKAILKTKAFG